MAFFLWLPVISVHNFLLIPFLVCWSVFSFNSIQPRKQGETMPGNQASAVPQGDVQRRARSESESETDEPAATRRRAKEVHRPQWTLLSLVEDVMLKGSTLSTKMKL
ncbi:retrotransposon hot spot (RHS) protein, partial [Trypanosoma cruzi]